MRLLLPGAQSELFSADNTWGMQYDGHSESTRDSEDHKDIARATETAHDINYTPKTPPRTPLTPTIDSSFSYTSLFVLSELLTNTFVRLRITLRGAAPLGTAPHG
ncbi:MAG: hypothetical protein EOO38_20290 [Cytophagaceae bacterium]|nr:MAG: hypothetical protein EOO38_20290 [Cytophagaceae bacterium]